MKGLEMMRPGNAVEQLPARWNVVTGEFEWGHNLAKRSYEGRVKPLGFKDDSFE